MATKKAIKAYVWDEGRDEPTYRGDFPNSISSSELKAFRSNRELFSLQHVAKTYTPTRKPALEIGSGVHEKALLPNEAGSVVTIPPECLKSNGARNTQGAAWKEFAEANAGKIWLTPPERLQLESIVEALYSNRAVAPFFSAGQPELPCKALDPKTGVWLRCRFDYLTTGKSGVVLSPDLKTTAKPVSDLGALAGDIERLGYARQAAFYRRVHRLVFGADMIPLFVFLEKRIPWRSRVLQLPPDWLDEADQEVTDDLLELRKCFEADAFVTPDLDCVVEVARPRWARYLSEYDVSSEE